VDRKKKLEDALDTLMEIESIKNFDFELWKARYLKWLQTKKMRITDFFRRQDKDGDGFLSRDEFVNGMLHSGKNMYGFNFCKFYVEYIIVIFYLNRQIFN
jgi:dystonin